MAKINRCLKCLFIFFNGLFAIFGGLMVIGMMKASAYNHQLSAAGGPNLGWSWVFAIGVLGISCLGVYAGCSEKELPLKIFAGFMGVGMVIMLICGIVMVVMRNKIKTAFENASSDDVKPFLGDEEIRSVLGEIQKTYDCCGIVSASDWGDEIPQSCQCSSSSYFSSSSCKPKPPGASGPSNIYEQTCGSIIFELLDWVFQISMGLLFGFAVTALMGLLVSLLMIHQVRRCDSIGGSIAMKGY